MQSIYNKKYINMEHLRQFTKEDDYNKVIINYPSISYFIDTEKIKVENKKEAVMYELKTVFGHDGKNNLYELYNSSSSFTDYFKYYKVGDGEIQLIEDFDGMWVENEGVKITFYSEQEIDKIGDNWFASTNIKEIEIPKSVSIIDYESFYYCTSLSSVTFEEDSKLTQIKWASFNGCYSLSSITIPSSVTSISDAFSEMSYLNIYFTSYEAPTLYDCAFINVSVLNMYAPKSSSGYEELYQIIMYGKCAPKVTNLLYN